MCAPSSACSGIDRRTLVKASLAVPLLAVIPAGAVAQAAPAETAAARGVPAPVINPRESWAQGRAPKAGMGREDVRFLLVHHTQTPNTDSRQGVAGRLRGMHSYHTGDKGWPDIAYNFLVDRYGGIWEGRSGSLAGPVRGDATGGSQGFAQLCCFIGDHTSIPPTPAAMESMTALLAWLAARYTVDLAADRTVTFVSRGSNRWRRGASVTTVPVAAHRDMSLTECPGDALYPLVRSQLWPQARARVAQSSPGAAAASRETSTRQAPAAGATPTYTPTSTAPASAATTAATAAATTTPPAPATAATAAAAMPADHPDRLDALPVLGALGVGGGAALAAYLARRARE